MNTPEETEANELNWNRIILGGVAAGVVIVLTEMVAFGTIFNQQAQSALEALGKNFEAGGPESLVLLVLYALIVGLTAVWLYAAVRPHYGAGPRTAAVVGLGVWALVYVAQGASNLSVDLLPASFVGITLVVGLVETMLATFVGAYLYRE